MFASPGNRTSRILDFVVIDSIYIPEKRSSDDHWSGQIEDTIDINVAFFPAVSEPPHATPCLKFPDAQRR